MTHLNSKTWGGESFYLQTLVPINHPQFTFCKHDSTFSIWKTLYICLDPVFIVSVPICNIVSLLDGGDEDEEGEGGDLEGGHHGEGGGEARPVLAGVATALGSTQQQLYSVKPIFQNANKCFLCV